LLRRTDLGLDGGLTTGLRIRIRRHPVVPLALGYA
jgi:hypothetical protein